jgi:three-Cys-motif partner protein
LESCKEKLASLKVDARMRALYVEKDQAAFQRLSSFLENSAPTAVEYDCRHGDFVALRDEILEWCGTDAFVFFFVDPTGWKDIGIDTMQPLLNRPRAEFLINFAYNFINRTASMKEWRDAMVRLLGRTVDLAGLAPGEREEALVDAYRESLKQCVPSSSGYRARTAYVRVLDPLHRRTKYHLIYLTSHPTGIVKFMDISEKVDLVQARVRSAKQLDARERKSGITDMFAADPIEDASDGRSRPAEVDAYWCRFLADGERRITTAEFADILEETNWLPGELQASLVRLVTSGVVRNLDADASRRRARPLHFEKSGERLQLVRTSNSNF